MSPAQSSSTAAKPKTFVGAFTDTWSEARMRRAKRERAAEERREKRKKPQPWIIRKLAVGFVIAILLWAQYVYVGRLCVPMLRRDTDARGSFGQGVAYIIVFEILWLLAVWCYIKIITVPPGFARDYLKKTPPPNEMQQPHTTSPETAAPSTERPSGSSDRAPLRSSRSLQILQSEARPEMPRNVASTSSLHSSRSRGPLEFPENNPIARPFGKGAVLLKNGAVDGKNEPSQMDAIPGLVKVHAARSPAANGTSPAIEALKRPEPAVRPSWDAPPPPKVEDETWAEYLPPSRRPNNPVLSEERRYCYKDELVKPYRCHHCSSCATDVLMFDHHCIWIGQCVGARNRKFFLNFIEWGTLLCIWLFATLVAANVEAAFASSLDGEIIAIIVISGFFMIFIGMLLASHVWLITINATTVEHLWMQQLQRRDTLALGNQFSFWNVVGKGRQRRQWTSEWGSIYTEGNIWWLGSRQANWEAMMGKNPLWWILPIGRSQSDGLSYPVNRRFSPDGRWRRRSEWPVDLQ